LNKAHYQVLLVAGSHHVIVGDFETIREAKAVYKIRDNFRWVEEMGCWASVIEVGVSIVIERT
jgi:hypothetical protein